jgi:hypothetical protein
MSKHITFSRFGSYGHLGNQLFQFCAVYSYSKLKNKQILFTSDKKNSMFFNCFDVKCDISFVSNITPTSTYVEKKFSYNPEIWNKQVDDLIGYFQSEKYFKQYENELRSIVKFKQEDSPLSDYVFIHVRRGDYLKYPDVHPLCSEEYYETSIEKMKNKFGSNTKFMVFSDDIEGTKQYKCFDQKNIFFSSDSPFISLYKMKTCMSGIIANSSFSWWGAWFIENKDKLIIAPKEWFGKRGPAETQHIYCEDWFLL